MENYRATRILSARWRNSAQKTVKPRSSWAGWPCFVFEMRSQLSGPAEDSKVCQPQRQERVPRCGTRSSGCSLAGSAVCGAGTRWTGRSCTMAAGGGLGGGRRRPCLKTRWAAFRNVPNRELVSMWWFASSPFSN